jgi:SAM-dependent methyltransferase
VEPEWENIFIRLQNDWWHVGRRYMLDILLNRLNLDRKTKILEIGCGTGNNTAVLQKYGIYHGFDQSLRMVQTALYTHKVKNIYVADAQYIPVKADNFTLILALDLLEHVDNDLQVISEAYRILRKHGYLLITVPGFRFLWSQLDVVSCHKRRYRMAQLITLLQSVGFRVVYATCWNFLLFLPIAMLRIAEKLTARYRRRGIPIDAKPLPKLINTLLLQILKLDNLLISKNIKLPVGVTLVILCKK